MAFYTHDNGGRPFMVVVSDAIKPTEKSVHVYQHKGEDDYSDDTCFSCVAKRVMVGESPKNAMTEFSSGHGMRFKGNSILVETRHNYTFIGTEIISFQPKSPIVEFVSPVGNNDVPYPWARDELGNTYLFIESVILDSTCKWDDNDPYRYFYDKALMTTDYGRVPPQEPEFPGNIKTFKVGAETYTLRYEPLAAKDYQRIMGWDEGSISVVLQDDSVVELSEAAYMIIMKKYGNEHGFSAFVYEIRVERVW
jgi:hypothetical protein